MVVIEEKKYWREKKGKYSGKKQKRPLSTTAEQEKVGSKESCHLMVMCKQGKEETRESNKRSKVGVEGKTVSRE